MKSWLSSRKFQLAVAAFLAGVAFFAARYMTAGEWVEYTRWIVGLYMVGNVGATVATKAFPTVGER